MRLASPNHFVSEGQFASVGRGRYAATTMQGKATLINRPMALIASVVLLVIAFVASLAFGAERLGFDEVIRALFGSPTRPDSEVIVWDLRMPRTVLGLIVGGALGLAGALMQSVTRNPLAEPGLFGVSAGAALSVVLAVRLGVGNSVPATVWWALLGAMAATALVFALSSRRGSDASSPVTIAVFGAAVSAGLAALTSGIVLLDARTMDGYRFWAVGSLAGRGPEVALQILPFAIVGVLIALVSARGLDVASLGHDVAAGLGLRVGRLRALSVVAIGLLTAAGVAACGPIAFLGLLVSHGARALVGTRHFWLLPLAGILGAATLLVADVIGRLVAGNSELQVGVVLGLIGGPFFVTVVARRKIAL